VIADRVVQAALKLVPKPTFKADFLPVSCGFRPLRRAHDAIAEIHMFGSRGYRCVLDAAAASARTGYPSRPGRTCQISIASCRRGCRSRTLAGCRRGAPGANAAKASAASLSVATRSPTMLIARSPGSEAASKRQP
jgi:hypothetical protein